MPIIELLEIPEGKLFWRFDSPIYGEGEASTEAESRASDRPTLLFIHAGVSNHTLWDETIEFLTVKGWGCLRYDLFGYGQSTPGESHLLKDPVPSIRHHDHVRMVVEAYLKHRIRSGQKGTTTFVVIGLSRGGGIAIDFTLSNPDLVSGLVLCAGGLGGFEVPNTSAEESEFNMYEKYMNQHEIESATRMLVRIWGDGPLEKQGRSSDKVREKLYGWCKDIVAREVAGTGGSAIPCEDLQPPAAERLSQLKVKTIVAKGEYDESGTNKAMDYVHQHVQGVMLKEFRAAHMINLECTSEFNDWLGTFLRQFP